MCKRCAPAQMLLFSAAASLLLMSGVAHAQGLNIGSGASFQLNNNILNLHCIDLTIGNGGALDLDTGALREARDFVIESGGILDAGASGLMADLGTWTNDGTVLNPDNLSVAVSNLCGVPNSVRGTGDTDGDGLTDAEEGMNDTNNDGILDFFDRAQTALAESIPALSQWGMIITAGLLVLVAVPSLRRRMRA